MFKIIMIVVGCLAQQAVFPPSPFSNIGALSSGIPGISVSQTRSPTTYNTLNQVITFTITITNPGTAPLVGPITITDAKLGTNLACASGPVAPGGMVTCSPNRTYNVTQADLDGGSFNVAATATAAGSGISATAATVTTTAVQSPSILLSKTPNPSTWSIVPTTINYTFSVQNTGNVTLTNAINITDPKTGGVSNCGGGGGLAPGLSKGCSASYTTVAGDAGQNIVNTATAATTFGGMTPMDTKTATVTFSGGGGLTIDITNPGHSLTAAACNLNSTYSNMASATDDAVTIEDIIYYANQNSTTASPATLTIPSGRNCALKTNQDFATYPGTGNKWGLFKGTFAGLDLLNNVTIQGLGAGAALVAGFNGLAVNIGQNAYPPVYNGPMYKIQDTQIGGTSITLVNSGNASNFKVGDILAWYEEFPDSNATSPDTPGLTGHCGNCDTIPMQVDKITGIVGGTLQFATPIEFGYTNGLFNTTGIGHCVTNATVGTNCYCVDSNMNICSKPYVIYNQCVADGSSVCTPGYPAGPNVVVCAVLDDPANDKNIYNPLVVYSGFNNISIVEKQNQHQYVWGSNWQNSTLTQGSTALGYPGGQVWNWNSVEGSTFNNVNFFCDPNCTGGGTEGPQRSSGHETWTNNHFGTAANPFWALWSFGEPGVKWTFTGNTYYLGMNSNPAASCGLGLGAAGLTFSNNTVNLIGSCLNTQGQYGGYLITDGVGSGYAHSGIIGLAYFRNCFYGSSALGPGNTVQCAGVAQSICFNMILFDVNVSGNNMTLTGGMGGIFFWGGYLGAHPDHPVFNANTFSGSSNAGAIYISGSSASAAGCSISGNTRSGSVGATTISDHSYCTIGTGNAD